MNISLLLCLLLLNALSLSVISQEIVNNEDVFAVDQQQQDQKRRMLRASKYAGDNIITSERPVMHTFCK